MSLSKGANPVPSLLISEKALHLLLHGISGGLAGCLATLVIYPIDNIKTRLQALAKQERKNSAETHEIEKVKHKGIRAILKQILEEEGPMGLYKGVVPCLGNMIVNFSVYFFWYELFKGYFIKDNFSLSGYTMTALLSGLITATCSNPWGVIHTRVLFEKDKKMSVIQAINNIYEKEGIEGFFKGLGAGYVLVMNPIIQFVVYEYLKKRFQGNTSSVIVFLIGAISKALATSVTYPYSTLKLLLQANKKKNEGQLHLLRNIYKKKGIKGFFGGFGAKLSHTVINSALLLMIYERVQNIVKQILLALLSQKRIA